MDKPIHLLNEQSLSPAEEFSGFDPQRRALPQRQESRSVHLRTTWPFEFQLKQPRTRSQLTGGVSRPNYSEKLRIRGGLLATFFLKTWTSHNCRVRIAIY